jgi:hypothetical protein
MFKKFNIQGHHQETEMMCIIKVEEESVEIIVTI